MEDRRGERRKEREVRSRIGEQKDEVKGGGGKEGEKRRRREGGREREGRVEGQKKRRRQIQKKIDTRMLQRLHIVTDTFRTQNIFFMAIIALEIGIR